MHRWLEQYHEEMRMKSVVPGFRREETEHVVRHISEYGEDSFIMASKLNEENARVVIRGELEAIKGPFEWKLYSYDEPANLKEILVEEGFQAEDEEAVMVGDVDTLGLKPIPEEIVELTKEAEIKEVVQLLEDIWGDENYSELGHRLWRDKQEAPEMLHLYGVYGEGRLVSACWMYLEKDSSFASLWGGATRPEYRKRGYYSGLVAIRAKKAAEYGYRFLTVDALPMSKPILEKIGFECIAYTTPMQSPR